MKEQHQWISASEVASFAYCPEAWRLEHGLELRAGNEPVREKGVIEHREWQQVEQRSSSLVRVAIWLFAAAVILWIARALLR